MPESISIRINAPPVRVCAKLWIGGPAVDPDAISALLGLVPSKSHKSGDPRANPKFLYKTGLWLLESDKSTDEGLLSDRLEWLLQKIEGKKDELAQLRAQGFDVQIVCRFDTRYWNTVIDLSPDLLARLSALALPLVFDIYSELDEDEDGEEEGDGVFDVEVDL